MTTFRYTSPDNSPTSLMPRLPMSFMLNKQVVEAEGLLDTGSAVNVLPYQIGLALGANWEAQTTRVALAGSLGQFEARALIVFASHPQITPDNPVRLVFAWTQVENAPLIFGQMNFFLEFNVCFYRAQAIFDVQLKGNGQT